MHFVFHVLIILGLLVVVIVGGSLLLNYATRDLDRPDEKGSDKDSDAGE